jgi:PAS domain S-box-containing protein
MQTPVYVTSAEVVRNFGRWQDKVVRNPVVVTNHGRPRCVLLSTELFDSMMSGSVPVGDADRTALEHAVLSERMDDGFVAMDASLAIVSSNAIGAMMLACPRELLIGASLLDILPTIRSGPGESQLRRTIRSGEDGHFFAAGAGCEFRVHAFPWPGGVAVTFRRSTVEDGIEKRMLEASSLRQALETHGLIGMAEVSVRGTFVSVDPAFADIAGFAADRLRGSRLVDILAFTDRGHAADAVERTLSSQTPTTFVSTLLRETGERRAIRISLAVLIDANGARSLTVVLTPDGGAASGEEQSRLSA